ncbi:U2 small nuclear ribonucleoprotein auxiliary factor 35 kDa subunit-related protein 1-like [Epinephelus moara]|uniref:U2 small nuclear ribonucleoprotein auxiliary factor 35 kDa subunit-related protein 1-like n=1 Tax=Epinephelus moara TaxID=300413 RepID=UPI00214E3F4A|nr:U2 small nuclear ribonucleoprotein auxiliary factor 35 kDa subunit-related protein 1-like [Epinephelus moara]
MTHMKRFQGIPMSKVCQSMRGLCKEEDYVFLGVSERTTKVTAEGAGAFEDDWRDKKEERVRRRLEREQLEKQRLQEVEESKKEREQQWRTHIEKLTSSQEKTLQDRLARLRRFREFQRKVLVEESGMEGGGASLTVNQLLTRM